MSNSSFSWSKRIAKVITPPLFAVSCTHLESLPEVGQRMDHVAVAVLEPDRESQKLMQCLGRQFETFRPVDAPTLYIAAYRYGNESLTIAYTPQDLPMNVTSMLYASLNQISPQITFMDILEPVDAIQWEILKALAPEVQRPHLILRGSALIPERATQAESSSFDFGLSLLYGSFRFSRKAADSIAGMELDLNAVFPERYSQWGLSAPIRLLFERFEGTQNTGAASVQEVALGAETVTRYTQSFGPALRLAIAHQVLKIIGRWQGLPYWQCVTDQPNVRPDEYVKRRYRMRWEALIEQHGLPAAYGWLQELLVYNGYRLDKTDRLDAATRSALNGFLRAHGKSFDAANPDDTLWELIQAIPGQSDATLRQARLWEKRLIGGAK